mmetsp:Transcript_60352/g.124865  ORF Transcript_60352/g.124865 Transcript_60352/m.124865 type:complete len:126 (+) Transcript_60352:412-789(+)
MRSKLRRTRLNKHEMGSSDAEGLSNLRGSKSKAAAESPGDRARTEAVKQQSNIFLGGALSACRGTTLPVVCSLTFRRCRPLKPACCALVVRRYRSAAVRLLRSQRPAEHLHPSEGFTVFPLLSHF